MTFILILFISLSSMIASAKEQIFIGKIPGEYLSKSKNRFYLGALKVEGKIITDVTYLNSNDLKNFDDAIHLKVNGEYAAIYPGLIDLHNHPKQCLLPLWDHAHGQFGNRHEWRDWSVYSHSLGGNMNPWSGNGKVEVAAAFRWSELQATVLGTTLMQGPRFYTNNFAISHVESGDGHYNEQQNIAGEYVPKELNTQAPTDLFISDEMTFIFNKVRPKKTGDKSFHDALEAVLKEDCNKKFISELQNNSIIENKHNKSTYEERLENYNKSPSYNKFHSLNVARVRLDTPYLFTKSAIKTLSDKSNLEKKCSEDRGEDFDLYFSDYHASIVNKILLLQHPNNSGIIAHLSEGRQKDPYNQIEFDIAKTMDLIKPGMSLVHGIGLGLDDLKYVKKNKVGIVWSPFSNLLLYGETLKIKSALELGINIALGSDWTPTGSKSVLEEVKIAKRFAVKNKLTDVLTDEVLYKMMTENPAKMINKLEVDDKDGRHGVGTLKSDAMASFIAVEVTQNNPYTNLVEATENEMSLVVSSGEILYGNIDLLQSLGFKQGDLDWVPVSYEFNSSLNESTEEYEDVSSYLNAPIFSDARKEKLTVFSQPKAYVVRSVKDEMTEVIEFKAKTGLDMSRPSDIQRVLHVLLTTQSRNALGDKDDYHVNHLPPLVSIADKAYTERFDNFIKVNGSEDELEQNYVFRLEWRNEKQHERNVYNQNNPHIPPRFSVPYRLAKKYGLDYDLELGVIGY